ncbi:type II toxin-antitoxin system Phd/YefM family antitoxin [Halomonas sp. PR-M31]|uniref:type II toxin-antitoxin system Phd/YefM family antitoxin n=1 Tax=Halomonas sp. PR-M31 TaxID=1471202 RepID=UPI000651F6C9|nr:prevent-host-death protein [Halomonas sp. PR-M31]
MKTEISKSKFKAHALEIFRQLEASDGEVIITDHGRPSLIIRKYRAPEVRSPLTELADSVLRYDAPFDPVNEESWEALS